MCTYRYAITLWSAFCSGSILEDMSVMYRKIFENNPARKQRRLPTSCWLNHAYIGRKIFLLDGGCLLSIHSMYRRRRTEKMGCEPCQIGRPKHGCAQVNFQLKAIFQTSQSVRVILKLMGKHARFLQHFHQLLIAQHAINFSVKGKACFSTILRPKS